MKIIVTGKATPLRSEMITGLAQEGHETTLVADRRQWPGGTFDLCVDTGAGGMRDIRRTVAALAGKGIHYILLSTCRVYPRVPRLVPWRTEDVDLSDEAGLESLDEEIRGQRAAERELKLSAGHKIAWTIMRPAIIEIKNSAEPQNMWWFVSRIMDGKPLVLPNGDDPLFRHVSGEDLVRAVIAVAGKTEAHSETIHVVDRALLSFEAYARLLMKSLGREVPLIRVPADLWNAAELALPMGREIHSSFIDSALLLTRLGWQPTDEATWVEEYARHLAANPLESFPKRQIELSLLDSRPAEIIVSEVHFPEKWCITGMPGKTNSLGLQAGAEARIAALPLLRSRKVALGIADEWFLTEGRGPVARVLGQNVLLEVLDAGNTAVHAGELYIPFTRDSCTVPGCDRCETLAAAKPRGEQDGFARELVQETPAHLALVSPEIAGLALLAEPLSCLLSVLPALFRNISGPVWFYGRRIESVLAGFLALDAGISFLHVDRSTHRGALPKEMPLLSLGKARENVRINTLAPPVAVFNLSGARDGENLLAGVLQQKGFFVSPFSATGAHKSRLEVNLPVLSPGRRWLEMAMATLAQWAADRDLSPFLRQVPDDQLHELFLTGSFQLPFLELK